MARPRKHCSVSCEISASYFKPQGIPMRQLEEIALGMDEVEAIRLADIEDLYHADAALKMGVSRPTFGNIIARARKKIATALLEGKALRISATNENIRITQEPSNPETVLKGNQMESNKPEGSTQNQADTAHSGCGCGGKGHDHEHKHEHAPGHGGGCGGKGHGHGHGHGGGGGCCGGHGKRHGGCS